MTITHPTAFVRATRILTILALGAGIGACGDDDKKYEKMSASDYDEVATTMGALVSDESRGEPSAYGGAVLLARGTVPSDFQLTGNLAIGNLLGLDYSFSVVCRDATAAEVACSEAATNAHVVVSWSGDWSKENVDASADFDGDWSLTGLDQPLILLDGSASASDVLTTTSDTGNQRSWRFDYTATYDAVAIDSETRHAVSGSVAYDLEIDRIYGGRDAPVEHHFSVDAKVSFQADGTATLALDGDQVYRMRRNGSVELVGRGSMN